MRNNMPRALLVPVLAMLIVAGISTPAGAGASGGGVFTGSLNLSPGLTTIPRPQSWVMFPGTIAGAVTVTQGLRSATYIGSITSSTITGGSPAEDCAAGAGVVNPFSFAGTSPTGTISGTLSGTYTRVGSEIVAVLAGTIHVNGPPSGSVSSVATVIFQGDLIPTSGNCIVTPVTTATVRGEWTVWFPV